MRIALSRILDGRAGGDSAGKKVGERDLHEHAWCPTADGVTEIRPSLDGRLLCLLGLRQTLLCADQTRSESANCAPCCDRTRQSISHFGSPGAAGQLFSTNGTP